MKLIVLKCPQCGAQLDGNSTRCDHCGTSVRLSEDKGELLGLGVSCPTCGSSNQAGDKHCGNCGEALTSVCPVPKCHEENVVWRKFCRKCGQDIIRYRISLLEKTRQKSFDEIQRHQLAISDLKQTLSASRGRATLVKSLIGVAGGLVAVGVMADSLIIGTIIGVVIALIVFNYESSETNNLESAMAQHSDDLLRFNEKYQASDAALKRLNS